MHLTKDTVFLTCLAIILAVLSIVSILILREVNNNQVKTDKFAVYMRCLIAPDEAKYAELGKEGYVRFCEQHLR